MAACILFIDSDHAKFFKLNPGKMETQELKKHGDHKSGDDKTDEQEKHFFTDVTAQLKGTTQLLIVGPGQAKARFKTHLEAHHHQELAKNVVGVETIDQLSDAKVIEQGKKFFKEYDLFH